MNETVLWKETMQPGASWSHVLKRGTAMRLTDIEGGANVGGIFYNFECPTERYNMPDTLKAQHIARLKKGYRVIFAEWFGNSCNIGLFFHLSCGSSPRRSASKDPEIEATYLKLLKETSPHEKAITRDLGR